MVLRKFSWPEGLLFLILLSFTACQGDQPLSPPPNGMVLLVAAETAEETALYVDETEVTVAQFRAFIHATGYQTEAEDFGWSGVFSYDSLNWLPVDGAIWHHPLGPDSTAAADNEPVTQVSLRDALAYAEWAGKRLPTEAEWLRVASHNGQHRDYPWGEEELPGGQYLGNWWQGHFPFDNQNLDGFPGIAPVRSYPPTELGLYDISGNVWEWTTTEGRGQYVIRGGSFLCSNSYCSGFNLQQRQYTPADSGLNHLGFRCVKEVAY